MTYNQVSDLYKIFFFFIILGWHDGAVVSMLCHTSYLRWSLCHSSHVYGVCMFSPCRYAVSPMFPRSPVNKHDKVSWCYQTARGYAYASEQCVRALWTVGTPALGRSLSGMHRLWDRLCTPPTLNGTSSYRVFTLKVMRLLAWHLPWLWVSIPSLAVCVASVFNPTRQNLWGNSDKCSQACVPWLTGMLFMVPYALHQVLRKIHDQTIRNWGKKPFEKTFWINNCCNKAFVSCMKQVS